jgi:chaperonin GroES
MSLNIKPLADRVVVEAAAAETKTASGIYIPETAQEKPQKGTIVAVGPGKYADASGALIPMTTLKLVTKFYTVNMPVPRYT